MDYAPLPDLNRLDRDALLALVRAQQEEREKLGAILRAQQEERRPPFRAPISLS